MDFDNETAVRDAIQAQVADFLEGKECGLEEDAQESEAPEPTHERMSRARKWLDSVEPQNCYQEDRASDGLGRRKEKADTERQNDTASNPQSPEDVPGWELGQFVPDRRNWLDLERQSKRSKRRTKQKQKRRIWKGESKGSGQREESIDTERQNDNASDPQSSEDIPGQRTGRFTPGDADTPPEYCQKCGGQGENDVCQQCHNNFCRNCTQIWTSSGDEVEVMCDVCWQGAKFTRCQKCGGQGAKDQSTPAAGALKTMHHARQ